LDAGAEYHGYTADVTRTLPINGTFTPEQKIIYDIVYEAQTAGINACLAGNDFRATQNAAFAVISKRLKELGIIHMELEALKYFFHGTSHYLGLDVHDAGLYGKLQPGNVITVEPGIYIPEGSDCDKKWWNIGVRIEDDILITKDKPDNLSGSLPRRAEEVEKMMREKSFFVIPGKEK
jgi:Xaa-Pro aminopeptidase